MAKKAIYCSIALIIVVAIFIGFEVRKLNQISLEIIDISIQEHEVSNADYSDYGLKSDVNQKNIKEVAVDCVLENRRSYQLLGAWMFFYEPDNLPYPICGKRIDTKQVATYTIDAHSKREITFYFLIDDSRGILLDELNDILSNVSVYIASNSNPRAESASRRSKITNLTVTR